MYLSKFTRKQSKKKSVKSQKQTTKKQSKKKSMKSFLLPKQSNKTESKSASETTIDTIISNITKLDISADAKIQMICEKLSQLETIDFHGVLIIPYSNSIVSKKEVTRGQTLGGTRPTLDLEHYTRELENELSKPYKDVRRISRIEKRKAELEELQQKQLEEEMNQFTLCEETYGKIKEFEEPTKSLIDKSDISMPLTQLELKNAVKFYEEFRQTMEPYEALQQRKVAIATVIETAKGRLANTLTLEGTKPRIQSNLLTEETIKHRLSLANLFDITANDCIGITDLVRNNVISEENARKILEVWKKNVIKLKDEQLKMFSKGYNPVPTPITTTTDYTTKFIDNIDIPTFTKNIKSEFSDTVINTYIYSVTHEQKFASKSIYDSYHMYAFYSKKNDVANTRDIPRIMQNNLHFTIHLGSRTDFGLYFNSGKTHMAGKSYSEQANMAPHIYIRESDKGFKVGPDEIIQIVPIYPGNSLSNSSVLYIGDRIQRVLNETLMTKQTFPQKKFDKNAEFSLLKIQIKNKIKDNNKPELITLNTRIENIQKQINNPETNMGNKCTIYLEALTEISNKITTFLKDVTINPNYTNFLDFLFTKPELNTQDTGKGKYKRKRLTKVSKKRPHKITRKRAK